MSELDEARRPLEAALERYGQLGQRLDGAWATSAEQWRALAAEVLAAEADVEAALTRAARLEGLEALVRSLSQARARLGEEVTRLARDAGFEAAPWPELLAQLGARAGAAQGVTRPSGTPLLVGPTPEPGRDTVGRAIVGGAFALWGAWYGLTSLGEYGFLLGVVVAVLGLGAEVALAWRRRFVVQGARLVRPGVAGRGLTLDLSAATVVPGGGALRVEVSGLGVEVPASWEHAGLLCALVEAARGGLLLDARRRGPSMTIDDARLGETAGAMLGWQERVLFVSDVAAPEALAALTGQPASSRVRGKDVLALIELLEPSRVRAGLARWKGLAGARDWPRAQCLLSPFPPWPKRGHYDSTERACPLEVSRGMEILTAKLTWAEAAEVASSLGLAPPA